jgi:hypothetical protein
MRRMLLRVVLAGSVAACGLATVGSGPAEEEPADGATDSARGSPDAGDATIPTDSTIADTYADSSSNEATSYDTSPHDAADASETIESLDGHAADADARTEDASTPDTNVADTNVADTNVADTHVADSTTVDSGTSFGDDCGAPTVASPLTAHAAPGPITVDGQLGDWPCSAFVALNASDGTVLIGTAPAPLSGEFAVLWDSQTLYVAAHVIDPTIATNPGNNAGTPWYNDAVETYFSGDLNPSGNYTSLDHQFVVDWKNLAIDYQDAVASANPGFVSQTSVDTDAGAWSLELSMPASAVGLSQFQSGTQIGFDILFEQSNGTAQNYQLVWHAPQAGQACVCDACCCTVNSYPYCDVLSFGVVKLAQ